MSDVGISPSIAGFLVGLVFAALDVVLLVPLLIFVVVQLVRKRPAWSPVSAGLTASLCILVAATAGSFAASEYAAQASSDYVLLWAPAALLLALVGGIVTGVFAIPGRAGKPSG